MDDETRYRARQQRAALAPGTSVRAGLERIVNGRTGALITMGTTSSLDAIRTGGFWLDVPFTPATVRELAKLDGAIICSEGMERILWAGVHLMPDVSFETPETGTRHRTADRVSQQTGLGVIAVSQSMSTISLYLDGMHVPIESAAQLLPRVHHALETLVAFRSRLQESLRRLDVLEVQDSVNSWDLCEVLQHAERVRRLANEIEDNLLSLGTEGRIPRLHLEETMVGLVDVTGALIEDYVDCVPKLSIERIAQMPDAALSDLPAIAHVIGIDDGEERLVARGFRQLAGISRLPHQVAVRLLDHFGSLQELFGAKVTQLQAIEGVGQQRARTLREGLVRIADSAYSGS